MAESWKGVQLPPLCILNSFLNVITRERLFTHFLLISRSRLNLHDTRAVYLLRFNDTYSAQVESFIINRRTWTKMQQVTRLLGFLVNYYRTVFLPYTPPSSPPPLPSHSPPPVVSNSFPQAISNNLQPRKAQIVSDLEFFFFFNVKSTRAFFESRLER